MGFTVLWQGKIKVGLIFAEAAEGDQVKWATQDELEEGFVQQVGELITEHTM